MTEPPGWKRRVRRVGLVASLLAVLASPWWFRPALAQLDFFRVRRVDVTGARYVSADEIVTRLRIDSTASIWDDAEPLETRVGRHPSVQAVRVRRRMPGTLVVEVTENLPVALVQASGGLVAVDATGRTLPIDLTVVDLDVPVLRTRDTLALRLLGEVRDALPAFFARIGDVRRAADGSIAITLNDSTPRVVLALADLSMERLFDILPVEADLARRRAMATEIDLRFRDQVIARLP
ncbi:MAG: FtsQ-type POTRA domain-containing protein [Gemmatimonadetes bacterium]|nr:FtsQ-type POTRA domain-containing protein [Gemmatimonadota bacterium]